MIIKMKTIAIIPSAGVGNRFGSQVNKIFYLLLNKPIIVRTLQVFHQAEEIDEIILVLKEDEMERGLALVEENAFTKVKKIAPGGSERQQSVFHALKLINDKSSIILIHDGVRPLVTKELISETLINLGDNDGVVPSIPLKDTIKEIKNGFVKKTVDRSKIVAIQTPQSFYFKTIFNAYIKAYNDNLFFTDDASVVEKYGGKIKIIKGDQDNIKITTKEDIKYAEFILKKKR